METFLQASSCKERGNNHYTSKEFEKAIEEYKRGILIIEKEKEKYEELYVSFHNNIAAGYLQLKMFDECKRYARMSIEIDSKAWKSYQRFLQACTLSKDYLQFFKFYDLYLQNCPEKAKSEEIQNVLKESRMKYITEVLKIKCPEDQKIIDFRFTGQQDVVIGLTVGFMGNNVYILDSGDECAIIDCPAPLFSMVKDYISTKGKVHLILTHAHLDHIFDVQEFLPLENVIVYCHKLDKFWLNLGEDETVGYMSKFLPIPGMDIRMIMSSPWLLQMAGIPKSIEFKNIEPTVWLGDQMEPEVIKFGNFELDVLHTPGHSSGCICLYNKRDQMVFTGDTLFAGSVGRYDLEGSDLQLLVKSIKEILYKLPEETIVYPGHPAVGGSMSTIGKEKKMNVLKGL